MNKEKMLEAFGDIDPKYVREAKPSARPRYMRWVGTAAAAAVLVLGLAAVLPKLIKQGPVVGNSSESDPNITDAPPGEAPGGEYSGMPGAPVGEADGVYAGSNGKGSPESTDELTVLVEEADCIVLAGFEGIDGELARYSLLENIKGEMPETFAVKNGVHTVEEGRYLLFLKRGVQYYDSCGVSAALIETADSVSAVNMPEGCSECGFDAVAELVKEIVNND